MYIYMYIYIYMYVYVRICRAMANANEIVFMSFIYFTNNGSVFIRIFSAMVNVALFIRM